MEWYRNTVIDILIDWKLYLKSVTFLILNTSFVYVTASIHTHFNINVTKTISMRHTYLHMYTYAFPGHTPQLCFRISTRFTGTIQRLLYLLHILFYSSRIITQPNFMFVFQTTYFAINSRKLIRNARQMITPLKDWQRDVSRPRFYWNQKGMHGKCQPKYLSL